MQVNILDAKNRLSQLVKAAQGGEDVVIANRGQPVVRLVAVQPGPVSGRPSAGDVAAWLDQQPLPAFARRPAREIDEALGQERDAWD